MTIIGKLMIFVIIPTCIYFMWKKNRFSYKSRFWITGVLSFVYLINTMNGNFYNILTAKSIDAEECRTDIRAYEFGREMASYSDFSNNLSLQETISSYSDGIGINNPYNYNNPCVKTGFNDAKKGKESIFNKSGQSWTSF